MRGLTTLVGTTVLLLGMAIVPPAKAQIVVGVGIGVQPVCSYGYYDYAPYACSPMGFYGPGYFYNGVFLGMGPWAGWGYGHGWGSHRFVEGGGGRYRGGGGAAAARGHYGGSHAVRGGGEVHSGGPRPDPGHSPAAHNGTVQPSHGPVAHASQPHAAPSSHGGEHPGGGGEHK